MSNGEWPPVKAQHVRLLDIYVLGPAMVLAGIGVYKKSPLLGLFVAVSGAGTTIFNAINYGRVKERQALEQGVPYLGGFR